MFPNVRVMMAAIFASVVVLICGFGMFAVFRVGHEPLVRLPPATAPLQLIAHSDATPSQVAAGEPFDRRFQISAPQSAGDATASPMRKRDRHDGVQSRPAAAAVPEPGAAAAVGTEAVGGSTESAASPAAPPIEEFGVRTVTPTADAHARVASEPAPAPAAAADADAPPLLSQETAVAEAGRETKPPGAAAATGEPAAAVAPSVAAIEPPTDQALAAEQTKPESELAPASVTKAAQEAAHKTVRKAAVKGTKRTRVAARTYRARRQRASTVAQSDTQTINQNSTSAQPNFRTAPQAFQTQPARVRRSRVTSRTAKTSSAVGGPLVSPTGK